MWLLDIAVAILQSWRLIEFRVPIKWLWCSYLALVIRKRKFAWHFKWVFCSQLRVIARVQGARDIALYKRQINVIHKRMGPDFATINLNASVLIALDY